MKTLKITPEVPQVIIEKTKSIYKDIEDIRVKLLGDPKLGFQGMRRAIRSRLSSLTMAIESYTGAPTKKQVG